MHTYYQVKEMLHKELEDIVREGGSDIPLDIVDKLLHSIKNADKIIMYEEYAEDGYSYADADTDMTGYSNARGRGRNAKRDSMGRYAREGGYSNRRGGYSRDGGYSNRRGRYSYADGEEEKIEMLEEMMNEASNEQEKSMLRNLINQMRG